MHMLITSTFQYVACMLLCNIQYNKFYHNSNIVIYVITIPLTESAEK